MRFIVLASLLTASPALAQTPAPFPIDPNVITRGVQQVTVMGIEQLFAVADLDRNGYLTPGELAQAASRYGLPFMPNPVSWQAFDLNRDGMITKLEVLQGVRAMQEKIRTAGRGY